MRQENHSMKAAYPFYLCLLSLKYSLTSESPTPSCSAHLKRETSCSAHLKWGTYLIRLKWISVIWSLSSLTKSRI